MKPTEIPGSTTPGPHVLQEKLQVGRGFALGVGRERHSALHVGRRSGSFPVGRNARFPSGQGSGEPPGGGKTACQL